MKLTDNDTKDFICYKCQDNDTSTEEKPKAKDPAAEEEKCSSNNWPSLGFIDDDEEDEEEKFQEWEKIFKPNKSPGDSQSVST